MIFCNEQVLQQVTSKFSHEQQVILEQVTSNKLVSTSNKKRLKSYACKFRQVSKSCKIFFEYFILAYTYKTKESINLVFRILQNY